MVELYKKVNKSRDNLKGIVRFQEGENPFTKPCLLCLSAQTGHDKSVFGAAKVGAAMAGCRVRGHYNGGYDIDDMPVSFLASRVSEREESTSEFVDTYLVPLVFENGQRVSIQEACRRMRNVNILTYCDGVLKALKIEKVLSDRLAKIGYSNEEINSILRNIFVLATATDQVVYDSRMSVSVFRDVLDDEVNSELDRAFIESRDEQMVVDSSPNCHYYFYKGDGTHDFKKYAFEGRVSALVSLLLSAVLENAIKNSKGESVPLDLNKEFDLVKRCLNLDYDQIVSLIRTVTNYDGAHVMSREEAVLRDELDDVCVESAKKFDENDRLTAQVRQQGSRILAMQKAIGNYCTNTNALRILLESCGWQVNKEQLEEIMSTPSDKEILESLDKARKK